MPFVFNKTVKIHYQVVGSGPVMVMHHGFGNCIDDYFDLGYVDALKDSFKLVMVDGRGFGKSDKPHCPTAYDFSLRTADTIAVLDDLAIDTAIAWGNSMGGRMLFALMHYYPERFSAYIAGGMHPFAEYADVKLNIQAWLRHGMAAAVADFEANDAPFPASLRERYLRNDPTAMQAVYCNPAPDFSQALAAIQEPVLLYCGSEEPYLEEIKRAATLLHQGEFKEMAGLSHSQTYWEGALVAALIKAFLQQYQQI